MPEPELFELCKRHSIRLEAYSPLAKGAVLSDPVVKDAAAKLNRTSAQVALQYLVQKGVAVVFTTSKEKYMLENAAILDQDAFVIGEDLVHRLDALSLACSNEATDAFVQEQ